MSASPNALLLAELQDAKEDIRMLQMANDDLVLLVSRPEIHEIRKHLNALRQENDDLRSDNKLLHAAAAAQEVEKVEAAREDMSSSRSLLENQNKEMQNQIKEMQRTNAALSIGFKIGMVNRTLQEHNRVAAVRTVAEWRMNLRRAFFEAELRIIANRSPSIIRRGFVSATPTPVKRVFQQPEQLKSPSPDVRDPSATSPSWDSKPSMSPHQQLCEDQNDLMMMMMMQKVSAMQADLSCQSPAERMMAESPAKMDQLREIESTVRHVQSTWRSRLQVAGFQLLQHLTWSSRLKHFSLRLAFLHWDQLFRSLKGKNLRTPSLYVRQSTAFVACRQDEVESLKSTIDALKIECADLIATRDDATGMLDSAMEEFRKYLNNVQGEFEKMQRRLVGSSLKLCIQQNLHHREIAVIQSLRRWQNAAAVERRMQIEQTTGFILKELETKFWEFAGFSKWRSASLYGRLSRMRTQQEQTTMLRQMPLLRAKLASWHIATHALSMWSARHQCTVRAAQYRAAILRQTFQAARKATLTAVITAWVCTWKDFSFKTRRACAYWSQFWQGCSHHKTLTILPRLRCWHTAAVADRLASANKVIMNGLEEELQETRMNSQNAETEATNVAQQAVLVAEKAEQQRSLSETHRKRCEAAMEQLAVQAKAREAKFSNQLEAANLMLQNTNQILMVLETEHASALETLEEHKNNAKELEASNASSSGASASEVKVMRQLWKQAEHERALLAQANDKVDDTKRAGWSPLTQLGMLKSKKERISQVAASLDMEPGIKNVGVLNGELLTICDELYEAAMLATSSSTSESFQPPVTLITA